LDRSDRLRQRVNATAAHLVRVVIADGQTLVRSGYRLLLEDAPDITVVAEATSGEQVVAVAERLRPDVVMIDAALPGLDCVDATRAIRALSGPAVMVLAGSDADDRVFDALRAGASGLIAKDTEPAELVRAVGLLARGEALLSPGLTRRLIAELNSRPQPTLPSSHLLEELTPREREVVTLVALGLSNDQIAERLFVTPATAKTHVSRAMVKLHARDRAQVVVFGYETGLVQPRAEEQVWTTA
jgi:DNA-binding NarL/FixJ family response regulator